MVADKTGEVLKYRTAEGREGEGTGMHMLGHFSIILDMVSLCHCVCVCVCVCVFVCAL